eukprot:EST46837.1 Hypothetical protein SS50377_13136 [Spironucleus salmonicida]
MEISGVQTNNQYDLNSALPLPPPKKFLKQQNYCIATSTRQKAIYFQNNKVQISNTDQVLTQFQSPEILKPYQKSPETTQLFLNLAETHPSIQLQTQAFSVLSLNPLKTETGLSFDLNGNMTISDVNNEFQITRAVMQLLAILFGTQFHSQIPMYQLTFEEENEQVEKDSRYFTLKKFFEEYLLQSISRCTDLTQKVLLLLAIGKFSEAAKILENHKQNRLALVVCAGKVSNWKSVFDSLNEVQICDSERILRVLSGDLTAMFGFYRNYLEIFSSCLWKFDSISEAWKEFDRLRIMIVGMKYEDNIIFNLIQLYGDINCRKTPENLIKATISCTTDKFTPNLCKFIVFHYLTVQIENSSLFNFNGALDSYKNLIRQVKDQLSSNVSLELYALEKDILSLQFLRYFNSFTAQNSRNSAIRILGGGMSGTEEDRANSWLSGKDLQRLDRMRQGVQEVELRKDELIDILDYVE